MPVPLLTASALKLMQAAHEATNFDEQIGSSANAATATGRNLPSPQRIRQVHECRPNRRGSVRLPRHRARRPLGSSGLAVRVLDLLAGPVEQGQHVPPEMDPLRLDGALGAQMLARAVASSVQSEASFATTRD